MDLETEAKKHFAKLEKSKDYHQTRLKSNLPDGIKFAIQSEIDMLDFMAEYAKEALAQRGVRV